MTTNDSTRASGPASAMANARAAALDELRRQPRAVPWQRDVARVVLTVLGSTALMLGVATGLHIVELDRIKERAFPLLLLLALQSLGVFAAIAPGKDLLRRGIALLAVVAAVAMVAGRGVGAHPATPGYACSTSHLAVDLIPLGIVLLALRHFVWSWDRSLLAGVAAAATGAIAGELSCARGWSHTLIHHIGAGLVIAVACVFIARARRPKTFAP